MTFFDYSVFGLRVRTELALPELFPAEIQGEPDVTIRLGTIESGQRAPGLHALGDGLLFVATEAGRYRIAGGREIIVEPNAGAPDPNVRLFLLGSAFGALLHQRGLLPLHANAVEIDGKAVAFMGPSGAGKSTLAAWFHDCGHRIIADDVCVVEFDEGGRPMALPGLPRLRLWREALEASGREAAAFTPSFSGNPEFDKFDVPVATASAAADRCELAALYELGTGDSFAIVPISGVEAVDSVFANTYRGGYVSAAQGDEAHWSACMRLVRDTPLFRVSRPLSLTEMDEQNRRLLDHAHGQAGLS